MIQRHKVTSLHLTATTNKDKDFVIKYLGQSFHVILQYVCLRVYLNILSILLVVFLCVDFGCQVDQMGSLN